MHNDATHLGSSTSSRWEAGYFFLDLVMRMLVKDSYWRGLALRSYAIYAFVVRTRRCCNSLTILHYHLLRRLSKRKAEDPICTLAILRLLINTICALYASCH